MHFVFRMKRPSKGTHQGGNAGLTIHSSALLYFSYIKSSFVYFLCFFRERSCQDQGIGNRNCNQGTEMQQAHFHSQTSIAGKCTKGVDGGMDEDAGQQAAAAIKNRDQQEADCGCKDDLAQIVDQLHTAAVEQVDDMSDAKSYA